MAQNTAGRLQGYDFTVQSPPESFHGPVWCVLTLAHRSHHRCIRACLLDGSCDGGFDQVPVRGESSRHYFAIEAREVRRAAAG